MIGCLAMARKLRVEYPGAIYHVMNRGDRREPIFKDDEDRDCFMAALNEACQKTGWRIHAWCLMPNHFHLVIETPQANLVTGMKWLLGTYTGRFNQQLLAQMKEQVREHHYGEERAERAGEQAEGIVSEGLRRLGWKEGELEARSKGDREKVKLAARLRAETTVTMKWIAERLRMGTWTYLNHLLYRHRQGKTK